MSTGGPRSPGLCAPPRKECLGALWREHRTGSQEPRGLAWAVPQGGWDLGQVPAHAESRFPQLQHEDTEVTGAWW